MLSFLLPLTGHPVCLAGSLFGVRGQLEGRGSIAQCQCRTASGICLCKADSEADTGIPLGLGWKCLTGDSKRYFPPLASSPSFPRAPLLLSNTLTNRDPKPVPFGLTAGETAGGNSLPGGTLHSHKFIITFWAARCEVRFPVLTTALQWTSVQLHMTQPVFLTAASV